MGLLKIVFVIFLLLFPIAEVGRLQFSNGVAVSLNDLLLAVVILTWLAYRVIAVKDTKLSGTLKKPLFIFVLLAAVSLVLNLQKLNINDFLISFSYLVRFSAYASVYFIIKDFDKKFRNLVSYLMVFMGMITVALGYIQYFLYPSLRNLFYLGWDEHLYRMFSSFLDPNFAGVFFALFFFYLLVFLREAYNQKNRLRLLLYFVFACLTVGSVYLTYSRSALLVLISGLVTYLFIIGKKKFILFAVIAIVLLVFLVPKSFKTEGTNFLRTASSEERLSSAGIGLKIFSSSPLYGIGFNAYRYAQNRLTGLNSQYWQVTHSGAGTDNSFLFVLATTGIIGFASFAYLLYSMMALGIKGLSGNKYGLALVTSLVGLMLGSLFINSFFYVFILEWVWIINGLTEKS